MPKDAKLSKADANPALTPPLMEQHMLKVSVVILWLLRCLQDKLVVVPGTLGVPACVLPVPAFSPFSFLNWVFLVNLSEVSWTSGGFRTRVSLYIV